MKKIKQTIIILLLILSTFILSGWDKKSVELLNNTPLIDLDKAIKESPIGKQGNTLTSEENKSENDNGNTNSPVDNNPEKEPTILKETKKDTYLITINNKTIIYNGIKYNDADALMSKIKIDCINGAGSIYLVDDYAASHIYNEVLAILEQLQKTMGLEYDSD